MTKPNLYFFSSQLNKLKKKLQARQLEASELKHLNVDLVSKEALTHDVKHFHSLIEKVCFSFLFGFKLTLF